MNQGERARLLLPVLIALLSAVLMAQSPPTQNPPPPTSGEPTEDKELEAGKRLYDAQCKSCHRSDGTGPMEEMDLTDDIWKHGNSPEAVEKVVREGIPDTGMRPIMGSPTDEEIKALVKYVLGFSKKAKSTASPASGDRPPSGAEGGPPAFDAASTGSGL